MDIPGEDLVAVGLRAFWFFAEEKVVEDDGGFHSHEEAGGEHGIDEAEGISQHEPALAVGLVADELVVGVGHDVGDALGPGSFFAEEGLALDGLFKAFFRSVTKFLGGFLIKDEPLGVVF